MPQHASIATFGKTYNSLRCLVLYLPRLHVHFVVVALAIVPPLPPTPSSSMRTSSASCLVVRVQDLASISEFRVPPSRWGPRV